MKINASLVAPDLSDEDLQYLTRELCTTLNDETDLEASLPLSDDVSGAKGDPVTIGAIVMAFVTSGAAVKLMGVLKAFFERQSSLKIELDRGDGRKMAITADNVRSDRVQETIDLARRFLEEGESS